MGKRKFAQRTRVLTGREARRYNERVEAAEQRIAEKEARIARLNAMTPQERRRVLEENTRIKEIERNGITLEHMMQAEKTAYERGVEAGKNATFETCYAAVCLALHELHGFGSKRCREVLNLTYEKMTMALNSADAIQQVYDEMGLEIKFNNTDITEDFVQEVV